MEKPPPFRAPSYSAAKPGSREEERDKVYTWQCLFQFMKVLQDLFPSLYSTRKLSYNCCNTSKSETKCAWGIF